MLIREVQKKATYANDEILIIIIKKKMLKNLTENYTIIIDNFCK